MRIALQFLSRHQAKLQSAWSLALWSYVIVFGYMTIGACIFPYWWKRFIFEGGMWQASYWAFAWEFLSHWLPAYHPLKVMLVLVVVSFAFWIVYRLGSGKQYLSRPPRKLVIAVFAFALITAVSLRLMEGRYETPDEITDFWSASAHNSQKELELVVDRMFGLEPPKSGLYIYLDSAKLDEAFSSLQQELTTVLARTTEGRTETTTGAVGVSGIDLSHVAAEQIQKSIDQTPTQATPARKAQWLIEQYRQLRIAEKLNTEIKVNTTESYALQEARKTLSARGVKLSPEQEKAIRIGDAKVRLTDVSKSGSPVFYQGPMNIEPAHDGFKISFLAFGGIKANGYLKQSLVDQGVQSCVREHNNLCALNARIMGQILRASPDGDAINLDLIPIALW